MHARHTPQQPPAASRASTPAGRPRRAAAGCFVLAVLLALAGCAAPPATPPAASPVAAGTARYGTIVAIRPLGPLGGAGAGAEDPRDSILDALGGRMAADARRDARAGRAMAEFIVRTDDGQPPTSVMQAATPGLHLGQRVLLTSGARTRIARAGG